MDSFVIAQGAITAPSDQENTIMELVGPNQSHDLVGLISVDIWVTAGSKGVTVYTCNRSGNQTQIGVFPDVNKPKAVVIEASEVAKITIVGSGNNVILRTKYRIVFIPRIRR